MTSFSLKIIAIISMFFDHFGYAFLGQFSFFNLIGRLAFPIFTFQISEGYTHTRNLKKYFLRLVFFALVSQLPFSLFLHKYINNSFQLNVFFTLFIGLFAIFTYDYIIKLFNNSKSKFHFDKLIGFIIVMLFASIAQLLHTDYGFWGIIVIFAFYLFKNNKIASTISFTILCILKYSFNIIMYGFNYIYILLCVFTILPILFIRLYNGRQGKKIKYLLYVFYPLHLLLLYFLF